MHMILGIAVLAAVVAFIIGYSFEGLMGVAYGIATFGGGFGGGFIGNHDGGIISVFWLGGIGVAIGFSVVWCSCECLRWCHDWYIRRCFYSRR
ncbi:hypothetical protein [Actinoallomurus sp. NPDC052274]|uniref:hypothetical protein n=1 Tax=Actinoallomurus sp. NPDC052274 TaxID=3155420 RepID=UPI0034265700